MTCFNAKLFAGADVDGERHVGIDGKRRGLRPAHADFLLRRGNGHDLGVQLGLVPREAVPVDGHVEERARGCQNGPQSRNCWYGDFDINTDYENKWPNTGNVREVRIQFSP